MGQGAGTREHGAGARGEMSAAELEAIGSGGGEGESESAGVVRALPAASLQDLGTPQIMITEVCMGFKSMGVLAEIPGCTPCL